MANPVWTPEQQAAIDHKHGPLRIIAGAGSGKTATMTAHITSLIQSGTAQPEQIVALTFTNAAAAELTERIQQSLGDSQVEVWSGTYHSFGGQIVSDGAITLDMPAEPKLLSEVEVWLTIRKLLQDGLEIEQLDMVNFGAAINGLVSFISRSKDELVTPDAIHAYIESLPEEDAEHAAEMRDRVRVYEAYIAYCHERGVIDFGDQIQLAVKALSENAELLAEYRDRYRFFVVDEYQDTNFAQSELVRLLAAPAHHLRVVGDPQQSIYRFRGAAVDNILRFSREIEGVTDVSLSTNFRSHQQILDVANRVVENAEMATRLSAHQERTGPRPVVAAGTDWSDETQWIAEVLEQHRERGAKSIAVLARKRKLLPGIARALERRGIPAQILGGEGIFDLPAVKDAVAMIRVLCNPADTTSAVRVLTSPRCGLNDHTVYALRNHLRSSNYIQTLQNIVSHPPLDLDPGVVAAVAAFCDELRALVRTAKSQQVDVLTRRVIARQLPDHPADELRALDQLVQIAGQFTGNSIDTSLRAFVDYLDALSQMTSGEARIEAVPEDGSVSLMTIHGAKGLEFDVVVIAGMNRFDAGSTNDSAARMFPPALRHDRDMYPDRADFEDREAYLKGVGKVEGKLAEDEERRLFYVAFTRARDALYLSWTANHPSRTKPTTPFKMLKELDDLVQKVEIPSYPAILDEPPLQTFFSTVSSRLDPSDDFSRFVDDWASYWRGKPQEAEAMRALDEGLAAYQQRKPAQIERIEQVRRTLLDTTYAPVTRSVFSYSQISTYEDCPRRYLLHYLVGVPENPANSSQTQLGSAFHEALQALHIAREHGTTTDFRDLVQRSFDETGGEFEAEATQRAIRGFLNSPDATAIPLATEQEFYLRLGKGRNAPVIRGFIDRIQQTPEGDIEIVDYKTNRQNKSRDQVMADLQLPIYVMACREAVGLEPRYATMAFVRHDNWVRIDVNDMDLTGARLRIESAIRGINAGIFDCTCGGSRCAS